MTIQFWLTIDPCSASNRLIPPEQMRRTLNLSGIQQDDPSLLISLHYRQTPSVDIYERATCMHVLVRVRAFRGGRAFSHR